MPTGQRRAPDLSTDGGKPPCGYWELSSGSLEEEPVLLTSEPSLQPLRDVLKLKVSPSFYIDRTFL